jgi:serine/threonine-protein kinase RsbT
VAVDQHTAIHLEERRVSINSEADIVTARQEGRALAKELGLADTDQVAITTAISEVARNIVQHAREGEIILSVAEQDGQSGIIVMARDRGPGIPNIERAMEDSYSTAGGLGLGLPGARRLMDEFQITSEVGKGTTVVMKKWRRPRD